VASCQQARQSARVKRSNKASGGVAPVLEHSVCAARGSAHSAHPTGRARDIQAGMEEALSTMAGCSHKTCFRARRTPLLAQPLLANLNPEQLAAVTLPSGHALILAGAGSGKTRVLTTRIAWLLQNGLATPGGILAVTFTNKAAKEMVARLSAMLPVNVRGMWIGTFHGLCNRLLRAHHKAAGLPQAFQILDTQDQLSAIKRLCKQYNVDTERFVPKQLQYFIAGCKEEGMRPGDVPANDSDARKKVEIYQLYEDQCQREGVVDFGELMLRSFELLRDNDPIRAHYQHRFATSWSTSSRTPTSCSTPGSSSSRAMRWPATLSRTAA
jgi:hypothetical protein